MPCAMAGVLEYWMIETRGFPGASIESMSLQKTNQLIFDALFVTYDFLGRYKKFLGSAIAICKRRLRFATNII